MKCANSWMQVAGTKLEHTELRSAEWMMKQNWPGKSSQHFNKSREMKRALANAIRNELDLIQIEIRL